MILLGITALFVLFVTSKAQGATSFDVSYLASTYGSDSVNRLQTLANTYLSRGLSQEQLKYVLSQDLHESGLFTDVANYHLMDDNNNYAGLTNVGGGYASYSSIGDFVDAHIGFLTKGSNPLDAVSLYDFNNRLVLNHYYTANSQTYYNDLLNYYNLLS